MTYKLLPNDVLTNQPCQTVLRLSDMASIPFAQGNIDYQEYLEWVAEGNTPQPADE